MAVTIGRYARKVRIYRPVGTGFKLAEALTEKGWKLTCQQWNDEDDLLVIIVPGDKADEELARDIDVAFPNEDFHVLID